MLLLKGFNTGFLASISGVRFSGACKVSQNRDGDDDWLKDQSGV